LPSGDYYGLSVEPELDGGVIRETTYSLPFGSAPLGRVPIGFSTWGRGCNMYSGTLQVHTLRRNLIGDLTDLLVTFEIICDSPSNWSRGCIKITR
jgi:hypothetical protein